MDEHADELASIRRKVLRLARRIDAPIGTLPTFGESEQSGRPSIEWRPLGFAYVHRERGHLFDERLARNDDELLYWIFRSVTQTLATTWELRNRVPGIDSRRTWMPVQLDLLRSLSSSWETRLREENAAIYDEIGLT